MVTMRAEREVEFPTLCWPVYSIQGVLWCRRGPCVLLRLLLLCCHNTHGGGAVTSTCAFIPMPLCTYHTLLCIGSRAGGAPAHAAPHCPALPVVTAGAVPACLLCLLSVVCILCYRGG